MPVLRWLLTHPGIALGGCLVAIALGVAAAINDLRREGG